MGITEERYLFLEKCILKDGMSRKAAIRALLKAKCGKKRDGKPIKESTAETMAYQRFSGEKYIVKPKKKVAPKAKAPTKKAPVKKTIVKAKHSVKTQAKKPAVKKPVTKKPDAKKPITKKSVAKKPAPKKAPAKKEKSFKEKALDEVKDSVKKVDKGDTPETRSVVKSSKKKAPIGKKTATPKSRKRGMIKEGSELVF